MATHYRYGVTIQSYTKDGGSCRDKQIHGSFGEKPIEFATFAWGDITWTKYGLKVPRIQMDLSRWWAIVIRTCKSSFIFWQ
eukprot:5915512-Karenia_brevis.AAC.1